MSLKKKLKKNCNKMSAHASYRQKREENACCNKLSQ